MTELWKPLIYHGEDFSDLFEVANTGKIRNKNTGKERLLSSNHEGYLYCVISRGRHRKVAVKVHRAVAENFVNGDNSLSIDHKDGDKHNNYSNNLEFVSARENNHRAIKNGLHNPFKFTKEEIETMKAMRAFCAAQWPPVRLPVATRRWQWPGLISHFPFNHNNVMFRHPLEQRV